jgi:hypothetical protein
MPYNAIQIYTPNARCLIGTITFTANIKPHATPEGVASACITHAAEYVTSNRFAHLRSFSCVHKQADSIMVIDEYMCGFIVNRSEN